MEEVVNMDPTFWHGKRVLVTGHTGFKGGWLVLWLKQLGATVCGIALPPSTNPNLFELAQVAKDIDSHFCDIRDAKELAILLRAFMPEIVIHLAAQPLVRASYSDPLETFSSNIMGTANVLDALRGLDSVRTVLAVTTDKVYRNLEQHLPYREDDVLGGHDPYSASKAASEIVIASYRDAFLKKQGVVVATARAGNVIGGGDWSNDRLIPDAVRSWQSGNPLVIRRPQAIRPWQHVLEPLHGYLSLVEQLWCRPELADAYNFGPYTHESATVREVVELALDLYGKGDVYFENDNDSLHETDLLTLETAKVRVVLGLRPKWNLVESVTRTMAWYKAQYAGADVRELCLEDLKQFVNHDDSKAKP